MNNLNQTEKQMAERCYEGMKNLNEGVKNLPTGWFPPFQSGDIAFDEHILSQIFDEMFSTYVKKNADYGNSFEKSIDKFGLVASAVRLSDKLERFSNLISNDAQVKDESIEDTLLDMANYAAMTVLYLRKNREKMDNLKPNKLIQD